MIHLFSDNASYTLNALALQVMAVGIAVFLLGLFGLMRERASQVSLAFFVLTSCMSLWLFAFSWMYVAPDAIRAQWWARAAYVGIALIPAAVYNFSVLILKDYQAARKQVILLWMASVMFSALMLATDLQFNSMEHYSWGYYPRARLTGIPFIVYFFGATIMTVRSYRTAYRNSPPGSDQRNRTRTLLIGFCVGFLGSVDFVASFGVPWHPTSHVPIFIFLLIAIRSVFHYRFMAITPAFAARQIIDTMNDGLIMLDSDGVVRLVNQAPCRLFGCREQDLIGRRPSQCLAAYGISAADLDAVAGREPVHGRELEVRGQTGAARMLSLSTSVLNSPGGEPLITVCVLSDISTRKRAEKDREELIGRLQDANRQLQTIDRMKSEFVSLVSHELRTPLTTIKAFTEIIMMKPNMALPDRLRLLETINSETDRLTRLISDILDLARIESGAMRWRMQDVSMETVIRNAVASMKPLFEKQGHFLSMDIDANLSSIHGDKDRLMQVVTNILSNAVKFTPHGGSIGITVSEQTKPERHIVIAISDTGIGIPAAEIGRIFEKFHRSADPLTGSIEGTGLGLAIAHQIIEHHGGTIRAESSHRRGSTFTITLPVRTGLSQSRTHQAPTGPFQNTPAARII